MAKSVNKVTLLGNVGNIEVKPALVSFSLATSESGYTKKDGTQVAEQTQWHRCVAFGKLAEIIGKYVGKGDKIYAEGKITYNEYEKDGQKRTSTDIVVNDITLLSGKSNTTQQAQPISQPQQTKPVTFTNDDTDGLPF